MGVLALFSDDSDEACVRAYVRTCLGVCLRGTLLLAECMANVFVSNTAIIGLFCNFVGFLCRTNTVKVI